MRLKLILLTTLIGLLAVLGFYGISRREGRASLSEAISLGAQEKKDGFNSDTGYLLPLSEPNYWPIRNAQVPDPEISARAFLLYEAANDKIVLAKNLRQTLPIASLTKLLTAVIAVENLKPEEVITIEPEMRNVDQEGGADFYLNEKIVFKDLLSAMLVKSSNDAAAAIAKTVERKTQNNFKDLMNKRAWEIGLASSYFLDPAGLNDEAYSTAADLLKLVRYSKNYPVIWQWLGAKSITLRSADNQFAHNFASTNKLFNTLPEIVGGKTGFTDGALGCLILEVRVPTGHGETSFLAIVLGSPDRFTDTKKLIEWGKQAFRWQ